MGNGEEAAIMLQDETIARNRGQVGLHSQDDGTSFEEFLVAYDGQHAEWFPDGRVEVQMAASEQHQSILIFLLSLLNLYLSLRQIGRVLIAPFVMKTHDDLPAREPDLMIILNANLDRIQPTRLAGPADIAIEIVSVESVERDYGAKFAEYEAAGVQEYWLLDPIRQAARVHELVMLNDRAVYQVRPLDPQGRLTSGLLPGFALDPRLMWQDAPPTGMALIALAGEMTGLALARRDESTES
ncbi:MAG: Uma2 family endonuclease [Anaerolineae bacterium]|nr:Uma2 family endonuclease [Anaerolineae bacterium]NUQ03922.1 Uma2 family endonuclease [Anaerolineae bacterium]